MNAPFQSRPRGLSRWRGREVICRSGCWADLREHVPLFEMYPFAVDGEATPNPYLRSIVRMPMGPDEDPIPVGVVSPAYALAQHRLLGDLCVESLKRLGLFYDRLRCDLELTELGEWMALKLYLGDDYSLTPPDGHPLDLRIELFNSVDGSSRLILGMSWFRLVCSNGLVVRDTLTELADVHDRNLDLSKLDAAIVEGLRLANADRARLSKWSGARVRPDRLVEWVDGALASAWGKKAAARCLHISLTGADAEFVDPFEGGKPSERRLRPTCRVPGADVPATTAYDIAQSLSWIATSRSNVEERLAWQTDIPKLIAKLETLLARPR